jgi:isocitrate dehydrogenase
VDIGAAKLADTPEVFDVIVMPNLYGDILSDVAAQIAGSVGLAGSSNIGEHGAMFEAIHGSAPRRAGQDIANPSGLILASVHMLNHLGQGKTATKIHNAWLRTIEDGLHTYDVYQEGLSKKKVGTKEFANAVIQRLGQEPKILAKANYIDQAPLELKYKKNEKIPTSKKELVGFDIFVQENNRRPEELAQKMKSAIENLPLDLQMITNRGVKVWPGGMQETFCTDHWRCRFMTKNNGISNQAVFWMLLKNLSHGPVEVIKTENLYFFDGEKGFSLGQGQ